VGSKKKHREKKNPITWPSSSLASKQAGIDMRFGRKNVGGSGKGLKVVCLTRRLMGKRGDKFLGAKGGRKSRHKSI